MNKITDIRAILKLPDILADTVYYAKAPETIEPEAESKILLPETVDRTL